MKSIAHEREKEMNWMLFFLDEITDLILGFFTNSSTGDHHLFCQKHFQWHNQNNVAVITRISMDWKILRAFTKGIFIAVLKTFASLNKLTNSRNRRFEIRVAPFDFYLCHANLHSRVLLQMKAEHASWNVIVIKSNPNAEEENWDSFHCELWCEASQLLEDSHTFDLAEIVRNQPPWIQIVQQVIYNVIIGLKGLFEKSCNQQRKKKKWQRFNRNSSNSDSRQCKVHSILFIFWQKLWDIQASKLACLTSNNTEIDKCSHLGASALQTATGLGFCDARRRQSLREGASPDGRLAPQSLSSSGGSGEQLRGKGCQL